MLIDDEIINVMSFNFDMLDFNNVDVFRQFLNQEIIIRMILVKNVYVFMKDMLIL